MSTSSSKAIAILGSTGSIGTQALEIVRAFPEKFSVELLTANSNADLLIQQALEFQPNAVVIADESKYLMVKDALSKTFIKVFAGLDAISQAVTMDSIDIVLTAMVGYAGLLPTIEAIKAKKTIALANKETLVVAGQLIQELAIQNRVPVIPVDSEHSAIFQCLVGESESSVEKIILTASGGPFRGVNKSDLSKVTKGQALKHPNWNMGAKITIDSATMMNKGLEVIEAKWLFNCDADKIEVLVHPESIVHSLVQFTDGSIKAQIGLPDMKLPIQYALGFPARLKNNFQRLDFTNYPTLNFQKPDFETFSCLRLAYEAMKKGGNLACILNAANEIAVDAFLHEKIPFLKIPEIIEKTMGNLPFILTPNLDDYIATDKESRIFATSLL